MPEMTLTVRWPDGRVQDCYSPSLVLHDHLAAGSSYTVDDFTRRCVTALELASERVRAAYGFACTSAAETTAQVTRAAEAYEPGALVDVLRMHPPLPAKEES